MQKHSTEVMHYHLTPQTLLIKSPWWSGRIPLQHKTLSHSHENHIILLHSHENGRQQIVKFVRNTYEQRHGDVKENNTTLGKPKQFNLPICLASKPPLSSLSVIAVVVEETPIVVVLLRTKMNRGHTLCQYITIKLEANQGEYLSFQMFIS